MLLQVWWWLVILLLLFFYVLSFFFRSIQIEIGRSHELIFIYAYLYSFTQYFSVYAENGDMSLGAILWSMKLHSLLRLMFFFFPSSLTFTGLLYETPAEIHETATLFEIVFDMLVFVFFFRSTVAVAQIRRKFFSLLHSVCIKHFYWFNICRLYTNICIPLQSTGMFRLSQSHS